MYLHERNEGILDNRGTAVRQTYYDSQRPKTTYISDVISVLNTYDQQGQLTKEVNTKGTYNYTYDTYGNIRSVSGKETHNYTYGNSEWLDLLTAYDEHSISYDAIGNPTNWYNTKAWNFTWQNGRQLATAKSGSTTISYTYDVAGIRDSKTVGSTVYNYLTKNGKVVRQTWGKHILDIIYDIQTIDLGEPNSQWKIFTSEGWVRGEQGTCRPLAEQAA